MTGHDAHQDSFPAPPDQHGRGRLGLRLAHDVANLEVAAFEGHLLLGPHALHDLDRLFEGGQAVAELGEGQTVLGELRLEPARTKAGCGTAVRDVIQGGDLFGEHGRIAKEGRSNQGAELHVLRDRCHGREQRPGFQDREVRLGHPVEVVADPDGVEAETVEFDGRGPSFVPAAFDLGQGGSEAYGS